jgi:hypothetical protein
MAGIGTMLSSTSRLTPRILPGSTTPWWLWLSAPLGVLGLVAAAVGAFVDGVYRAMTANWAQQTFAQDWVRHRLGGVVEIAGESDVVHVRTVDRR